VPSPSWDAPVRGLDWVWPVEWEVGYWVAGTIVALLLTGSVLTTSWRQQRLAARRLCRATGHGFRDHTGS